MYEQPLERLHVRIYFLMWPETPILSMLELSHNAGSQTEADVE
jgi:hypothetical protein